jgi:hypothetical protein
MIARGCDAADVAISTSFGASYLQLFRVWTDEIDDHQAAAIQAQHRAPQAGTWAA